jgi:stage V sporulation protein K
VKPTEAQSKVSSVLEAFDWNAPVVAFQNLVSLVKEEKLSLARGETSVTIPYIQKDLGQHYVVPPFSKPIEELRESLLRDARAGNAEAQARCADPKYSSFFGISDQLARRFLNCAAESGNPRAAVLQLEPHRLAPSLELGRKLISFAAQGVDMQRFYWLGDPRSEGWNDVVTVAVKEHWSNISPEDPNAMFFRWNVQRAPFIVSDPLAQSDALLRKAADLGSRDAQFWASKCDRFSNADRSKFLRKAAAAGHGDANFELGQQFHTAQKVVRAFESFTAASSLGQADAEAALARMHLLGEGVERDAEKALRLFLRAGTGDPIYLSEVALVCETLSASGVYMARSCWGLLAWLTGKHGFEELFRCWERGAGLTQDPVEGELLLMLSPEGTVPRVPKSGSPEGGTSSKKPPVEELHSEPGSTPKQTPSEGSTAPKKADSGNTRSNSRAETPEQVMAEFDTLVGLQEVKTKILEISHLGRAQQAREAQRLTVPDISFHMVLRGPPGTGKSTTGMLIGRLFKACGLLKRGHCVLVGRSNLVGPHVGQTAPLVQKAVESALDGVLFIDEAYSLIPECSVDYGYEAISTLVQLMEERKDRLVVCVAGYPADMMRFVAVNPGLESRFRTFVDFRDFSPQELHEILRRLCQKNSLTISPLAEARIAEVFQRDYPKKPQNFGNGRDVRNFFEGILAKQAIRLGADGSYTPDALKEILEADIPPHLIMQGGS